ncbi:MAG: hypothetical protein QOF13_647 [Solirubrobacterales bacterium]|nr:hypothetical protein [Solirubrobacterales bacterium]
MEIRLLSTDDPRRVWQPWEEPAASAARPQDDAGGSGRAQRRACHRGQPHRERQARPPSLNGGEVGRGRWPHRERSAPLSIRPASRRLSAVEGRPFSWGAYFVLNVCRSGATGLTGVIFIPLTPSRSSAPGGLPGRERGMVRKFLALAACLALRMPVHRTSTYAQTSSKRLDRPDWRGEWA